MHGIGEVNAQGNMLNALTKHSLPRVVEDPMFNYPFIVVSPQINNDGWVNHAAEIGAALDRVETEFGGDKNREYLTGLSYGGVGTLAVGIALADRIAALMPVTPGGSVANWDMRSKIANKPIWFFLGVKDNEYTANMTRSTELEASGRGSVLQVHVRLRGRVQRRRAERGADQEAHLRQLREHWPRRVARRLRRVLPDARFAEDGAIRLAAAAIARRHRVRRSA